MDKYTASLSAEARASYYRLLIGNQGNDVRVRLPDDAEVAASSAGCQGHARTRLYGSVSNFLTVYYLPELAQRRASAADNDPDMRTAYDAYSQCMRARGYTAATPADALALAKTYYPQGRRSSATPAEKTLAITDAQCRINVQLYERHAGAVDRIVRRWLAANESAVVDAHAMLRNAVSEASAMAG